MNRRAFTLIELTVSLGVVSVLVAALASTIMVSMRTLPNPAGLAERQAATGDVLSMIGDDLRLATSVTVTDTRTLTLKVPDRTGDAAEDSVVYTWSGTAGDDLTHSFNGEGAVILLTKVIDFDLMEVATTPTVVRDRSVEPTDRLCIEILSGLTESVQAKGEYRVLNSRIVTTTSGTAAAAAAVVGGP